jgi:hypothetical protein
MRKEKKGGSMPVEEVIREHRKFGKRLESIGFTVSSKGRQIIVKFGKKLNIIECPTIEAAQSLADGFNATIQSRATQINEFIILMEANCQQLNLFAQPKPKSIYEKLNEVDTSLMEPVTLSDDAPAPTENPFEGIEEQEVPDHHQS